MGIIVLAAIAATHPARGSDSARFEQAEESVRLGRLDHGIALYRQITGPFATRACLRLAQTLERVGDIAGAIKAYQRLVNLTDLPGPTVERVETRIQLCKKQRTSHMQFPVSVEVEADIRQVKALLRAQKWHAVFEAMGAILDRFGQTFLACQARIDDDSASARGGVYRGVWSWAASALDALPEDAGNAYLQWSQLARSRALAHGSDQALVAFLNSHPGMAASSSVWNELGNRLLDRGQTHRARGIFRRLHSVSPSKVVARKIHMCESLIAGDQPGAEQAGSLIDTTPSLTDLTETLTRGWELQLTSPMMKPSSSNHPAASRAVLADNRAFIRVGQRVYAFAAETGSPLWVYEPPSNPPFRQDVSHPPYAKGRWPWVKWAGTIDVPGVKASPAGILVRELYVLPGEEHQPRPDPVYGVLKCLSAQTGRVLWSTSDCAQMHGLVVSSEPAWADGLVVVVARTRGDYPVLYLCALDGQRGSLAWRTRVAAGAGFVRCLGRGSLYAGLSGQTLLAHEEGLYYATHMGAVLCIDRDLAEPIWASSYPRVARFGPPTRGPLPLLLRRTDPLLLRGDRLILLPRDANALYVLDRRSGEILHEIRSYEMTALCGADDRRVHVATAAGEIRTYDLDSGRELWRSETLGRLFGSPVLLGEVLAVTTPESLVLLDAESGRQIGVQPWPSPMALEVGSGTETPQLVAGYGSDFVRIFSAKAQSGVSVRESDLVAAAGRHRTLRSTLAGGSSSPNDTRGYEPAWMCYADDPESRLVDTDDGTLVVTGDRASLSCRSLEDGQLRWRWPWNADEATWCAAGATILVCPDGEALQAMDPTKGSVLWNLPRVDGNVPIRRLMGAGRLSGCVFAVGSSRVTALDVRTARTLWSRDFSPAPVETIFVGRILSVVTQPMLGVPATVVRLEPETGRQLASYRILVPPLKPEEDAKDEWERYPLRELSYTQTDLRCDDDQWRCPGAGPVALTAAPIAVRQRAAGQIFFEMTGYLGSVREDSGDVTLLAPHQAKEYLATKVQPTSPSIRAIVEWRRTQQRGGAIRLEQMRDAHMIELQARDPRPSYAVLVEESQAAAPSRTPLRGLRAKRVQSEGGFAVLDGQRAVLVLRRPGVQARASGRSRPPARSDSGVPAAETVRDLASALYPRPVNCSAVAVSKQLDGELSDWPADGWAEMSAPSHWFRASSVVLSADEPGLTLARSDMRVRLAFERDEKMLWCAFDVADDVHSNVNGFSPRRGDCVELLLYPLGSATPAGRPEQPRRPLKLTLALAENAPVCVIEGRSGVVAQVAGPGPPLDSSHGLCYRQSQAAEPCVLAAIFRNEARKYTSYETAVPLSLFEAGMPSGVDVRVLDNDGDGVKGWLAWGGALTDAAMFPLAPILNEPAGGSQR